MRAGDKIEENLETQRNRSQSFKDIQKNDEVVEPTRSNALKKSTTANMDKNKNDQA